jgi:hypothetical protein
MASGDSLVQFSAGTTVSPSSNSATPDVRNDHLVVDFDASTNETVHSETLIMPQHYAGGTITILVHYAMSTATSGDVDVDVAMEADPDDLDTDAWGTTVSVDNTTVPGTAGAIGSLSFSLDTAAKRGSVAGGSEVAAGSTFRIKITRDAVSDTAAGDMELIAVELQEA